MKGRSLIAVVFGISALLVAGCQTAEGRAEDEALVVIPDAGDVAEVRVFASEQFPDGKYDPKNKFDLKLRTAKEVKPVLDWLRAIGWKKSQAEDIRELRMVAKLIIVGQIEITRKDKTTQRFELQPDHIMTGDHRWAASSKKLHAALKAER